VVFVQNIYADEQYNFTDSMLITTNGSNKRKYLVIMSLGYVRQTGKKPQTLFTTG
jgi:hypothetical protein